LLLNQHNGDDAPKNFAIIFQGGTEEKPERPQCPTSDHNFWKTEIRPFFKNLLIVSECRPIMQFYFKVKNCPIKSVHGVIGRREVQLHAFLSLTFDEDELLV
jgi:hypothetical protein